MQFEKCIFHATHVFEREGRKGNQGGKSQSLEGPVFLSALFWAEDGGCR